MAGFFACRPEAGQARAYRLRREEGRLMEKEDLTHKVIGCAYQVYNSLGFGFLESVYRKAMVIELDLAGLKAEQEQPLQVHYRAQIVGDFSADLIIEDDLIVELKSVERMVKPHEAQLVNYLVATGIEIGLLINFGPAGVDVKRKYRTKKTERERDR